MDIECDIVEAEEAQDLLPKLRKENPLINNGDNFVYHLTKSGKWIERLVVYVWLARGKRFTRPPAQKSLSSRAKQIIAVNQGMSVKNKQSKLEASL